MDRLDKIRRVIVWTVVGFAVLLGVALLALQTEPARAFVLDQLTEQLNRKLAGEVEADRVSGTLLWGATLHDFELRDATGSPVLQADEVDASYSIGTLLGGDLVFSSVELEKPELTVRRNDDGQLNLATIAKPKTEPEPVVDEPERDRLAIYRFNISQGTIHYEDRTLTGVDAAGTLRLKTTGAVQASIDELALESTAGAFVRPVAFKANQVKIETSESQVHVTADQVSVGKDSGVENVEFTRVEPEAEGAAEKLSASVGQLRVTPRLARLWSPDLELASPVEVQAEASGTMEKLEVTAVAKAAKGGRVQVDGTLQPSPMKFDVAFDAQDFDTSNWVVTQSPLRLDAEGTVTGSRAENGTIRAKTKLVANNLVAGDYRAENIVLGGKEQFSVVLGAPSGADGSRALEAKGEVSATGVRGEKFSLGEVGAVVDASAKSLEPGTPIDYELVGTGRAAKYDYHAADAVTYDLAGTLVRAPDAAEDAVARLTAKGTAGARGYRGKDLRMKRLDTRVDMVHTPDKDTGDLRADLDQLVVSDRRYGSGRFNLDITPEGNFSLDIRAVPDIMPDLPIFVRSSGKHGEEFESFMISSLELGRPGLVWKLRDQARVQIGDKAVVIDSMVLEGPGEAIRLDGRYPVEGLVAALVEKVGMAGIDALLQSDRLPEELRKRLPKDLEEITPDELEKAIPDEVEEKVGDEIRKRIRLPEF